MIDMQRKPEMKKESGTMLAGSEEMHHDEPRYPWGLEIRLEGEDLEKLGIQPDAAPQVGQVMRVGAIARVTGFRVEQMQGGKPETCLTLQIEQMELGVEGQSIAERMYGKG
jgi:hypothetical protein